MPSTKKELLQQQLFTYALDDAAFIEFLLASSNLPGPRSNLELGYAFADDMQRRYASHPDSTINFCEKILADDEPQKYIHGNEEFLPFCALVALGAIAQVDPQIWPQIWPQLKLYAADARWRIRESVAMAIQRIVMTEPQAVVAELQSWMQSGDYLVYRAVLAGLAESAFMKNKFLATALLHFHKQAIQAIIEATDTKAAEFIALHKGMCYTISVNILGIADEGFAYLKELSASPNKHVRKIVKENLKKNRLIKLDADKVAELLAALEN